MCTLPFVFLAFRDVSNGPVRVPRPPQRHWEADPEWLKCHCAERQQSGPGSRLEVDSQYQQVHMQLRQIYRNLWIMLTKKSHVFFGALHVAFKLPNAEEAARCSMFLVSFGRNLDNMWYNWLSNKQFALKIFYAAQIDRQERVSHSVSVQMVEVGFCWMIYITWYKPVVGEQWIFICYWAFSKLVLCN